MTAPVLADQTGAALQYVADLREISTPNPGIRQLRDPAAAAELLKRELGYRLDAVFREHPGDPVILLSGGVDSIAVAAAAADLGVRPHAITITTAGGTDAIHAAAAAEALGLTHEILDLDDQAVTDLAQESVARLGTSELWEISYAVPLLAAVHALDRRQSVGPILTGSAADAILAGGKKLRSPIESANAVTELDSLIRRESAANFRRERLVPDFYERIMPTYADQFVLLFQTVRFWQVAETFAPEALFGDHNGVLADKLCLRLACEQLLPDSVKSLAWAQKSAIQRSAGIMDTLALAARRYAAGLPGATTYTDPISEDAEAVATRLFLALLDRKQS
ncbi:asparagine synthase-related protein [Nocardia sp. NPDC048505]|uniref:asparagine synthase-related protein n=1 Tax=Nocardia sp. NPDC048505 TaxID=3155756 RepID=UPI0033D2F830